MEVMVGRGFGLDVSSTSAGYGSRRSTGGEDPTDVVAVAREIGSGFPKLPPLADESSESSSSVGAPGDTDDDDDDEVSSKGDGNTGRKFGSLGSLEDALPIKRGLSNHFTGKSKSFANLSQVVCTMNNVKEVEKQENPFNKRRRILIQSRLARKSFYNCSFNPKSMPLLPVVDENDDSDLEEQQQYDDDDEEEEEEEDCRSELSSTSSSEGKQQHPPKHGRGQQMMQYRFQKFHDRKLGSFKSHSCFSLSDLQEEEDDS